MDSGENLAKARKKTKTKTRRQRPVAFLFYWPPDGLRERVHAQRAALEEKERATAPRGRIVRISIAEIMRRALEAWLSAQEQENESETKS